jgi:hypothetical protein
MNDNAINGSKIALYAGRILSALAIVFLIMDGGMKLFKPPFVVEATTRRLGYRSRQSLALALRYSLAPRCTSFHARRSSVQFC